MGVELNWKTLDYFCILRTLSPFTSAFKFNAQSTKLLALWRAKPAIALKLTF